MSRDWVPSNGRSAPGLAHQAFATILAGLRDHHAIGRGAPAARRGVPENATQLEDGGHAPHPATVRLTLYAICA